jgi:hypothetical protein
VGVRGRGRGLLEAPLLSRLLLLQGRVVVGERGALLGWGGGRGGGRGVGGAGAGEGVLLLQVLVVTWKDSNEHYKNNELKLMN